MRAGETGWMHCSVRTKRNSIVPISSGPLIIEIPHLQDVRQLFIYLSVCWHFSSFLSHLLKQHV